MFLSNFAAWIKEYNRMITRILGQRITERLGKGKAIIVFGARQVGKTTLLRELFRDKAASVLWLNGDEPDVRALFENATSTRLSAIIGDKKTVVVDEAQRINNVGLALKLVIDNNPDVQVVATGSSSFDLANMVNEPLTGRKYEMRMFPLSFAELSSSSGLLEETRMLPHRLVYGSYPDVVNNLGEEREVLQQLADSYLYKDILAFDKIKKNDKIEKLLQAIAYQVGSEVSFNELSQTCGLDPKTVDSYVQLLEKAFIIFRLPSYSRNLRNELKFAKKIYFWDCGIRNAVIGNFQQPETRADMGALFENYVIAERLKQQSYGRTFAKGYFWRTSAKQEIDYIEEKDGEIAAYEFKWNPRRKASAPLSFARSYPDTTFNVVTRDNYWEWLGHSL